MIIESLYHLASLDFGWFISLAMENLLWVAIFFAAANLLDESKGIVGSVVLFIFFVFDLFAEFDFSRATGWAFTGAEFLLLVYLTRTIVSIWCETTPSLQKHTLKILTGHWLAVYIIYSIFLSG